MHHKIPLPRGWNRRAKSAILHILALSHYTFTVLLARAALKLTPPFVSYAPSPFEDWLTEHACCRQEATGSTRRVAALQTGSVPTALLVATAPWTGSSS